MTTFIVLLVIFLFGGAAIKGFIFALMIGVIVGTYSSICIADDYTPLSDWRASAGYRRCVAQNLLRRFYLECEAGAPVQVAAGAVA